MAFICGIAAGAAATAFMTSDKGDKTRAAIINLLQEKGISKDKFEDIIARVKAKINEITDMSDIEVAIDESIKEQEEEEEA
ncbi:MAG: hypothetical protein IIT93_01525 [Paludibacteraceae bacterium]|nr:hypothetical protein [Paludibacteraceae bacterium]MBQ1650824.1 hypothetical protein [Paludibacteraceae bacterium]MBQ1753045.1 hypothetical protein [Paludibacteraceae bacterium]MBQ5524179.1 hypothetical protein [Paludibacteraceae bacterium]